MKTNSFFRLVILAFSLLSYGCSNRIPDYAVQLNIDNDIFEKSNIVFTNNDTNDKITVQTKSNFSTYQVGDRYIYFSVKQDNIINNNLVLYSFDKKTRKIKSTEIVLYNQFIIAGNKIYYTYNDHPLGKIGYVNAVAYFPVIGIMDLDKKNTFIFDPLKELKLRPTIANIELVNNELIINYFWDSPTPIAIAAIDIKNNEIKWLKK